MRLNPEESLEWLEGYEPDTQQPPKWVREAYKRIVDTMRDESEQAAALMLWAKENGVLDSPVFTDGRPFLWPVKTGRNRP